MHTSIPLGTSRVLTDRCHLKEVVTLEAAVRDLCSSGLSAGQQMHVRDLWSELCYFGMPSPPQLLDVRHLRNGVHEFFEVGGPLAATAVSTFFACLDEKTVLVLGAMRRTSTQAIPPSVSIQMENRLQRFLVLAN